MPWDAPVMTATFCVFMGGQPRRAVNYSALASRYARSRGTDFRCAAAAARCSPRVVQRAPVQLGGRGRDQQPRRSSEGLVLPLLPLQGGAGARGDRPALGGAM